MAVVAMDLMDDVTWAVHEEFRPLFPGVPIGRRDTEAHAVLAH